MKKIAIWVLAILITAGLAGGSIYLWMNNKLEKNKNNSQSQIDSLAKQVEIEKITPYEFYPSGIDIPDYSNWKTYDNKDYQYSFRYPDNWKIIDSSYADGPNKVSQIELLPNRYYNIWKDLPKTADGTVPNTVISCQKNKTATDLLPDNKEILKGLQNINIGAAENEQTGKFYLSTPLWDIQHFVTDYKNIACDLSQPSTAVSPLTKEEDMINYVIFQTFKFNKD